MPRSACCGRPPRLLRHAPVDPFQQISQLRRRDRHRPIRRRWPDEAPTLQPLGVKAHALPVVPQDLEQRAAPPAEHEQMALMRIALELLLHQKRQSVEALAHVGVAGRKPYARAARDRDHRRRSLRASAVIAADTLAASIGPPMRSRAPVANSTSITPPGKACGASVTAAKAGAAPPLQSC